MLELIPIIRKLNCYAASHPTGLLTLSSLNAGTLESTIVSPVGHFTPASLMCITGHKLLNRASCGFCER